MQRINKIISNLKEPEKTQNFKYNNDIGLTKNATKSF
jgi:hypothetical protein